MCGLLRLWGILCAVAAQSVQNAALTLQRKAVLGHQMGPHFVHEVAVQMIDAPALYAFEVQMLPAVRGQRSVWFVPPLRPKRGTVRL